MKEDAGKWINRVSHQLKRQMTCQEEQNELTNMQKHILHFILFVSMERDVYQKDVEKEFKVRRSTATGTLQLLEKNGYIYREAVEADARLKRIVPTGKALALREELLKNIQRMEERLRSGIPEKDMNIFIRVLKQISENLSCSECSGAGKEYGERKVEQV